MIRGQPAKAVATLILGRPLGDLVGTVSVRPPTEAEKEQFACTGLTVGDVWAFEMDGPHAPAREFTVTSK